MLRFNWLWRSLWGKMALWSWYCVHRSRVFESSSVLGLCHPCNQNVSDFYR